MKSKTPAQAMYNYRWNQYSKRRLAEHPLCVECLRNGKTAIATCTDHIIPHRGDYRTFWDTRNHQSLCPTCHARKSASEKEC